MRALLTSFCQRDLIVDLLLRIEDDDMGVMNIVSKGLVACCNRQSGCVSFFENTKIIKKIELLLLSRSRLTIHPPTNVFPAHSAALPSHLTPTSSRSIVRLRTLSLLAQLRESSTDAAKNVDKTLYKKVLSQELLGDDVLGRMATFELFKTMGAECTPCAFIITRLLSRSRILCAHRMCQRTVSQLHDTLLHFGGFI